MAEIVNGRCHAQKAPLKSPSLFQHGNLDIQAHHIGWLVSGCFTLIAMITSFWLMNKHLQWYTNKGEQRYIIRILLMVPLYAVISFASYLFWNHSTPLLLLRDCYESTVLTSFFYLLLMYISPDLEEQKETFRKTGLSRENDRVLVHLGEKPKRWMFPIGFVKWKPQDGLFFLQVMKWGVLQYCVVRPITTLAAVILDYAGLYCEDSWSPGWGHIYITVIVSISVSIAMYCLIQLYVPVSSYLAAHKPLLKLIAIKAVVFLTFWQASGLSLLTLFNVVRDTPYMTAENINIGIGAILETFEMMIFAFVHIRAFTYKPYRTPPHRTRRLPALAHAFNFRETLDELWEGTVYLWHKMRGRETDVHARRQAALESIFGQSRLQIEGRGSKPPTEEKELSSITKKGPLAVQIDVEEAVYVGQERQWLGVGDQHAYALQYQSRRMREKSEGLEEGIERELAKRGYMRSDQGIDASAYEPLRNAESEQEEPQPPTSKRRRSLWRNVFHRLSQSDRQIDPLSSDGEHDASHVQLWHGHPLTRGSRFQRVAGGKLTQEEALQQIYEDPPPPSVIRSYRNGQSRNPAVDSVTTAARSPLHFALPVTPPRAQGAAVGLQEPPLSPLSLPSSSESFFIRAFPAVSLTDEPHSVEILTADATSSQSHRSRVRLTAEPLPIASQGPARSSVIVPQPSSRRHAAKEVFRGGEPSRHAFVDLSESLTPAPRRSSRRRRSALSTANGGERERASKSHGDSRHYHPDDRQPLSMPKPPKLRRDQIVLPAPLAAAIETQRQIVPLCQTLPLASSHVTVSPTTPACSQFGSNVSTPSPQPSRPYTTPPGCNP